jgi:hypothetical protein
MIKFIKNCSLKEHLLFHLYLKQNEYLSHPILVSKCIGHCSLKEYLTSQIF